MLEIDLVGGLRGWRKWSEKEDIARLMEMGADRIELLEGAGALGRLSMLRRRVQGLKDEKEKMLKRLQDRANRSRFFASLISDLDPEAPIDELREKTRHLRAIVLDQ